ncbi:MAG TPA: flagellar hook basal-body protein [Bryobacteraceae bacterium]|nr:flagellar hook basal-body protein [Bryobacteraceae bacterium]
MDALTISAASGLRARMETLDMLANNLANAATGGFKSDREFYSLYASPEASDPAQAQPQTVPVIEKHWTDFSQGLITPTGNALDLALSGKGFFTAAGPNGPLYTRNGNFRLSPSGVLVTAEGYPLVAQGPTKKIQTQSNSPIEVLPDGEVHQDGQTLGSLELVDFPENTGIAKQGSNYFQLADINVKPAPAASLEVQQGKLENSNVSPAESAVRLVNVMRQFEMLQRAVSLGNDMNNRAIQEVARVGS